MNKLTSVLIALALVVGIYLYSTSGKGPVAPETKSDGTTSQVAQSGDSSSSTAPLTDGAPAPDDGSGEDALIPETVKPAADSFKSAEEALAALLKGAKDYDDATLEQFTQPGPECTWCPELYASIRTMLSDPATTPEQRSYLAEVLAISGRPENVQALLDGVSAAKTKEEASVFAEALELTIGGDDVTNLLGQALASQNDQVRESSVAAITNQGTRLAAELLIANTLQRGDPDGYYSSGIGIGEFIPNEEALPLFQEMVQRRDEYSHLGVKALINSGLNGLRIVFDELENTSNPDIARAMTKDAIDHVNFEDGLSDLVNSVIERNRNPEAVKVAQGIKKEIDAQNDEDAAATEVEP